MSLTKADSYKNNREKRKKEEKKKKLLFRLKTALAAVIIVLIVVWIGFSGYSYYQEKKPMTKTELSMTALNEYMSNLSSTDSATE